MKIWAFCVFMPQKLQDMSSFLGFGGNSALLLCKFGKIYTSNKGIDIRSYCKWITSKIYLKKSL